MVSAHIQLLQVEFKSDEAAWANAVPGMGGPRLVTSLIRFEEFAPFGCQWQLGAMSESRRRLPSLFSLGIVEAGGDAGWALVCRQDSSTCRFQLKLCI